MKVRLLNQLNPFQQLTYSLARELRARGYDSTEVVEERVSRIMSTVPGCRRARDACGYEWMLPPEEVKRISLVVQSVMAFQETPMFYFNGQLDLLAPVCEHGHRFFCEECRNKGVLRSDGRKY